MASKGPLAGATITIFTLLPNGQRGSQIVPGAGQPAIITQANGSWTAAIPGDVTGPLLVVATGGTFLDEVTGRQIPIGDTTDILGLLPAGATTAAITPITHAMALAAQTALQRAAATGTSPDVNAMVSTVIFNATQTFGFDPVRTLPPDPRNLSGQSTVAVHYAAILVGLSQLLADARGREAAGQEPTFDVGTRLVALAQDLIDGVIDGQQAGQPITAPNGQVVPSLIPTPQTKTLADVVNIFALFPPTDTGLDDTTLQSTLSTDPVAIVPPPGGNLATPQTTNPQNQAPAPAAPAIRILENTPGTSQVSPNDPDAGESFTFVVGTKPAHGTAIVNRSGLVTYIPDTGFTGTDSIVVTVSDNGNPSKTGTVTIAVTVAAPPNTAPAPTAPAIRTTQNTPGTSRINPNDSDVGETFTFAITTRPAHGTASVDATGRVTYTPASNFTGSDSLTITVTDNGTPPLSGAVTINVTVANRPPAPTAPPIGINTLLLYPGQKFAAGRFPVSVTVADVNGDGNQDLIVANVGSNNVSVLLGQGDGTFQPGQLFAVGTSPSAVAVADLNGDGHPDLVVANASSNDVSVLLGQGDGTFAAQQPFAAGTSPRSVAVADLNGDNHPDLVVANQDAGSVSTLLGQGNGTFAAQQPFAAGTSPGAVAVADLNGDGPLDLIVANIGSNDVSVLLGQGNGTFQPEQPFATGTSPRAVAVADLNGDNHPDLIVANAGSNDVSVLLGQGNGTFQPEQRFATGSNPVSVAVADVNGDSLSDLIVANQGASDVSVLLLQQQKSDTTQVTPNDPDVGQTVTFAVTKKPINGTASVDASGVVTYIPALNFTGSDSLVVTVTDNGVPPLAGTVTIAVTVKAP